jgi:putative ABC transport system ATP-binding protein
VVPAADAFTLKRVTVRRGDLVVLDQVTCHVPAAACTAVVGPSGAGKTTLLRLLNRLTEPTTGTVSFHGTPLPELDVLTLRRRVGLVPQLPVLLTDTVADELRVGHPDLTTGELRALLDRVGLTDDMLGRASTGLSGGEAQRVCLARALAVDPEVLLLDEPTSALDPGSAAAVATTVRGLVDADRTVVLVSHRHDQARRVADHVLVLLGGRLVETGPATHISYLKEGA